MRKSILRIPIAAAALLLCACEQGETRMTSPDAAAEDARALASVPAEAARLAEMANRLAAEYESGVRDFPPMSADPRASVSPETLRMMIATADRLAQTHGADAD